MRSEPGVGKPDGPNRIAGEQPTAPCAPIFLVSIWADQCPGGLPGRETAPGALVQMLWGRRRGRATIVAVKRTDGAPHETRRFEPIPRRLRSESISHAIFAHTIMYPNARMSQ
jgi:hypothetical protein